MSRRRAAVGRHAAVRRRTWFGRRRTRALMSLGVLALGSVGLVGTSAYWTDTATVDGAPITSGSMDLQLQVPRSTSTWEYAGSGGSLTDATFAVSGLTPGESQAFNLAVRNVGQPTLAYSASVVQTGSWTYTGSPIVVHFYAGATARATNAASYPRSGTCSGTALGTGMVAVTGTASVVVPTRTLAGGASEQLCLVVAMDLAAGNANQGQSGTLRLDLSATQVTS